MTAMQLSACSVIVQVLTLASICNGFLLDIDNPLVYNGTQQSSWEPQQSSLEATMFGYSLAFLNDSLLVGAPQVNHSRAPSIVQPGGVYSCPFDGSSNCALLNVDNRSNNIATAEFEYKDLEDRSHQRIGASLATDPSSGFVCTCAPRFISKSERAKHREPTGMCYYKYSPKAEDLNPFDEFSPCKTMYDAYFESAFVGSNRDDSFV